MVRSRVAWLLVSATIAGNSCRADEPGDNTLPKTVADILAAADSIELLSLDPQDDPGDGAKKASKPFQDWKILGSATITDRAARGRLVEAVAGGIPERASPRDAGLCFQPRHGLRASAKGAVAELVICYECARIYVYIDGKLQRMCVTKSDPQKALDDLLTAAKVPLPPKLKNKD